MKRFLSVLLSTLMLVVLLAPMAQAEDQYDLTFWVYSDWTSGKQAELLNQWADEFVAAHDNVNSITMIGKNDNDLLTGVMAGVGLPDCYSASFRDGLKYYESVNLLDLMPYYEAASDEYRDGWISEAIESVQIDGGMWALPYMSYIPLVFRNLDVLAAAGVDTAKDMDWTWDDFIEQCKAVEAAGYDATHKWSGDWYTAGAILASEPDLTPGLADGKTTVTADELLRTFQTIQAVAPYTTTLSYDDDASVEAFKTNKLAFTIEGPWNVEGYDASGVNYDIVPVPAMVEGGKTGGMKGWDAVYAIDSGDATKNELIADWLMYITDYAQQKEWTSHVGRPVLRQDVMDDPDTQTLEVAAVSAVAQLGGMKQMDFFQSNVFWPSTISGISEEVAQGTVTPEDACTEMVDAINAMYVEAGEE
jgi:multiple sugar transport system substrate-binding protein